MQAVTLAAIAALKGTMNRIQSVQARVTDTLTAPAAPAAPDVLTDAEACAVILESDPFQTQGAPCWGTADIRVRGQAALADLTARIDQAAYALRTARAALPCAISRAKLLRSQLAGELANGG